MEIIDIILLVVIIFSFGALLFMGAAEIFDLEEKYTNYRIREIKRKREIENLAKEKDDEKDKKNSIFEVVLEDKYYDFISDNDDMDDIPHIIKITYNAKGQILNREHPIEERYDCYEEGKDRDSAYCSYYEGCGKRKFKFASDKNKEEYVTESSPSEQYQFFNICGINPNWGHSEWKKYTTWKGI